MSVHFIPGLTEIPTFTKSLDAEIYDLYGAALVNRIGLSRMRNIPTVSMNNFNLDYCSTSLPKQVEDLSYPICRGIDIMNRSFILIKVFDNFVSTKYPLKSVLLIINQSPIPKDRRREHEYNYTAVLSSPGTALHKIFPRLDTFGPDKELRIIHGCNPGMSEEEMQHIADLMDGEKSSLDGPGHKFTKDHFIIKRDT